MTVKFSELGLSEDILKGIEELGFLHPTEVQEKSITRVLDGLDLVVKSKTGSGKTAAFGLPVLEKLDANNRDTQVLILTPTRELAVQVDSDLKAYSKYKKIKAVPVYGQHSINTEIDQLEKGAQVITGTPGRVYDHIKRGTLKTKDIKYLILDEADVMLNMGFIDQVKVIINKLPKDRITMLFSASMPDEIKKISNRYMKDPTIIEIASETETVDTIAQYYFRVKDSEKRLQLNRVLISENPDRCIVFCNTRIEVDRITEFMKKKGFPTKALHGAISQSRRLKTINSFKEKEFKFLVATDVASRGIHVNDVSHVINYDLPVENDSYIHRIGRTGRAGNGGIAISLVNSSDLFTMYEVEELIGMLIEERELPTDEVVHEMKKKVEFVKYERSESSPVRHDRNKSHSKPRAGGHTNRTKTSTTQHKPSTHSKPVPTNKSVSSKPVVASPSKAPSTPKAPSQSKVTSNPKVTSKPRVENKSKTTNESPKHVPKRKFNDTPKNTVIKIDARDYNKKKRKEKMNKFFKGILGKKED